MTGPDIHEGLTDLEAEVSPADLLADAVDDPIVDVRKAAGTLREGDDEAAELLGESPEEEESLDPDDAVDADDESAEADATKGEDADVEKDGDAAEDESKEEGDKATDEGKTFDLEVPTVHTKGHKGKRDARFVLEGLPQEFHDELKGHINRSMQHDSLTEQLGEAREAESVASFVDEQPLTTMVMLDQRDRKAEEPKGLGERFTKLWMRQNPKAALSVIEELGYHRPDELNSEMLKERAENADLKAQATVREGVSSHNTRVQRKQWANDIGDVIKTSISEANLSGEDAEDLRDLAINRIRQASNRRKRRNLDPLVPKQEVLGLVQPLLARFAANGSQRSGTKGKKRDLSEKHKHRARVAKRTRSHQGGKDAVLPGTQVTAKKLKDAKGVKAAAAILRKS